MIEGVEIKANSAVAILTGVAGAVSDWTFPLSRFWSSMVKTVREQIATAGDGEHGGQARGVYWKGLARQYVRADGTEVPATGGVPKSRGKGLVQGKRRKGGKPLQPGARLYGHANVRGLLKIQGRTPTAIEFGPGTKQAVKLNTLRQYLFFSQPKESKRLERFAIDWVMAQARKAEQHASA